MSTTIAIPPADLRTLTPQIAAEVEAVERMRAELAAATAAVRDASIASAQAEANDRQARADHARGKLKQAPKPTIEKARATQAEAEENVATLELALSDAQAELAAAITDHRDECAAALTSEHDRARDEVLGALAEVQRREVERARIAGLLRWLHRPQSYAPTGGVLVRSGKQNGEPQSAPEVIARVEAAIAASGERTP